MKMNRIGILTSGGDAPGMNAAIRAATRSAISRGIRVMGIYNGYRGLIEGEIKELSAKDVSDKIMLGGTFLYTSRCDEFNTEAGLQKAVETCKDFGIGGLVIIGGDGSLRGARDLSLRGIPCVGIPGSIDNDVFCSEYAIGFDTAVNTAMEMIGKLRDTAESHHRCSVVEVMGRHCGNMALHIAIASGATSVLLPEFEFDFRRDVIKRIQYGFVHNKLHSIVVVAEGVSDKHDIKKMVADITAAIDSDTRLTVLGHVQRGGSPTLHDRVLATRMGDHAAELLERGVGNRVVAMRSGKITDLDIYEALNIPGGPDRALYDMCFRVSV